VIFMRSMHIWELCSLRLANVPTQSPEESPWGLNLEASVGDTLAEIYKGAGAATTASLACMRFWPLKFKWFHSGSSSVLQRFGPSILLVSASVRTWIDTTKW
jgi:hypothetical protein